MTDAEKALLDIALSGGDLDELREARKVVLLERLPEGFAQNLEQLVERYHAALEALRKYESLSPMGHEMRTEILNRLRERDRR